MSRRPVRLVAQDAGFSVQRHRFKSGTGYLLIVAPIAVIAWVALVRWTLRDSDGELPPLDITLAAAVLIPFVFAFYAAPSIIAAFRRHPNLGPIIVINAVFGWTVLGYVVALAWSVSSIRKQT